MKNFKTRHFMIFLFPTLVLFTIAFVIPFIGGIGLSFFEFTTVNDLTFVGIENYIKAFETDEFGKALLFTLQFMLVAVVSINLLAFLFASILTKGLKGTNVFRTLLFMPNLIGGIVLGYIWQSMLNGVLINFEKTLLMDASYGFWGMVMLTSWQMIGYIMVIYIAGIQNVPTELIESARIDGASRMQVVKNITIPMIMPSIVICLFLTITNALKTFDSNLALTGGGPGEETVMLSLDIYNTFYNRMGYEGVGQSKAVIFFMIVGTIAITQVVLTRKKEVEA